MGRELLHPYPACHPSLPVLLLLRKYGDDGADSHPDPSYLLPPDYSSSAIHRPLSHRFHTTSSPEQGAADKIYLLSRAHWPALLRYLPHELPRNHRSSLHRGPGGGRSAAAHQRQLSVCSELHYYTAVRDLLERQEGESSVVSRE